MTMLPCCDLSSVMATSGLQVQGVLGRERGCVHTYVSTLSSELPGQLKDLCDAGSDQAQIRQPLHASKKVALQASHAVLVCCEQHRELDSMS